MNRSMPGLPVHHQFLEFTQMHVHWVGDVIQPSHSLSSPSPPALNLSQYQGPFKWVSSSHQVAKVLELQLQHQSFQWIFRVDFLEDWLVWSPCSPRDSQESSPTPQFKSINSSVLILSHKHQKLWTPILRVPTDNLESSGSDPSHIGSPWHHPSEVSTSICLLAPSDGKLTTLPRLVRNLGRDQFNLEVDGLWAVEH